MDAVILSADGAIELSFGNGKPLVVRGLTDAQFARLSEELSFAAARLELVLDQALGYRVHARDLLLGCRFEKRD